MILLQETLLTTSETNADINNLWFIVEIIIIVAVIAYQIFHSIQVYRSITDLQSIFDFRLKIINGFIEKEKLNQTDSDLDEIQYETDYPDESLNEIAGDDIIKLSLVDTKGINEIIKKIKTTLNTYLINNYGAAVNFSIIKDIIDREVEVKDEEITQTITTPLYFGLAATMIGIIFGLMAMPSLTGTGFSEGVNALIRGVKWAMFASLFGLFCTTILSSFFYKDAKKKVQREKNDQLSYLQAKLLPELIKAEDTGVSGLKASLDRFAREATNISDNVLIAANQTGENLILQQEIIDKIDNIDFVKISKLNMELFNKLDENMEAFQEFSSFIKNMESISSSLFEFAKRTENIDNVINNIDTSMKDSKMLFQFLTSHLEKVETAGNAALKSVGLAESHFETAIESLKNRTDEMINNLYTSAGNHESKLEDIYNEIQINLKNITSNYISEFSDAYSNTIPNFEHLNNLALLPTFKEEFSARTLDIQNGTETNVQKLVESINRLNDTTTALKQCINSEGIMSKLGNIEENIKSNMNRSQKKEREVKKTSNDNSNIKNGTDNPKPVTLGELINKMF
ncbi:MAG: hypothetical protein ACQERU_13220 [Bacteroidota bacterium]